MLPYLPINMVYPPILQEKIKVSCSPFSFLSTDCFSPSLQIFSLVHPILRTQKWILTFSHHILINLLCKVSTPPGRERQIENTKIFYQHSHLIFIWAAFEMRTVRIFWPGPWFHGAYLSSLAMTYSPEQYTFYKLTLLLKKNPLGLAMVTTANII